LAVVEQTKEEAVKFGIGINCFDITNYDQLKNIENINQYSGVVLDESSILKGRDGKLSSLIIETFKTTPYKLACTATPSPNDHMELGQHSEFLGAMGYLEMLAMFFVHDVCLNTASAHASCINVLPSPQSANIANLPLLNAVLTVNL